MEGPNFADWPCSVARVMDIIGDRWTLLVLRDVFHGIRRYDDFQSSLGIARNTLSDRLNRLMAAGLLTTQLYQDNPPRKEYLLTEMGADFFPVMASMVTWGDRWLDGGEGPPIDLHPMPLSLFLIMLRF
jgi:DNA-binding HxlR family transcriptional regulator